MNAVVHFEMPYDNRDRVARFYATAFGWQMQNMGEEMGNYVLAVTTDSDQTGPKNPGAINGGFFEKKPDWPMQHPSVVIAVDDIQRAMKNVVSAEGVVLGEPMDIPGVGQYVSITDTEGNRVGVLQPVPRPKPQPAPKPKAKAKAKPKPIAKAAKSAARKPMAKPAKGRMAKKKK